MLHSQKELTISNSVNIKWTKLMFNLMCNEQNYWSIIIVFLWMKVGVYRCINYTHQTSIPRPIKNRLDNFPTSTNFCIKIFSYKCTVFNFSIIELMVIRITTRLNSTQRLFYCLKTDIKFATWKKKKNQPWHDTTNKI